MFLRSMSDTVHFMYFYLVNFHISPGNNYWSNFAFVTALPDKKNFFNVLNRNCFYKSYEISTRYK